MPLSHADMQSRGEALPLATDANRIRRKAMKARALVKSSNANAGPKAMALKESKPRKLARFPKSPRKPPTRASNAAHTRSQGAFPDPPVRIQHPRLRTEEARFGIHEGRFHCGALVEERMRVPLRLVAASLKESTIPGAGRGIVVREDVPKNKKFLEYGGECITLAEAKKRQNKVHIVLSINCYLCLLAQTSTATQGNHHIKRLDTFAVDSKPTLRRPYLWFAERHLLAGFANTLDRSLCNCKFVTVGDRIFLESTKPLLAGMEVIAFYERSD